MTRASILLVLTFTACSGGETPAEPPPWIVDQQDRASAMLGIWAASGDDVWAVGGDARDGAGPIIEHYDGSAWTAMDSGERSTDLWSVFGFEGGPVFIGGSKGTILRVQNGTFEKMTTPGNAVVFGLWGAAPDDVWAVGGQFAMSGFAWHWDGATWTAIDGVPDSITTTGSLFKVFGRSPTDVSMSGTDGTTLHWDGTSLSRSDVGLDGSLFSVAGSTPRWIAVGGDFTGKIYEDEGGGWSSVLQEGAPILSGVSVLDADAYAVGHSGTILRRGETGWTVQQNVPTRENLHAAFIDPSGGIWVVGGDFDAQPTRSGVLIHRASDDEM